MRERNEALDCYVYARASASAAGLDRFEERHWRELEKQLGLDSIDEIVDAERQQQNTLNASPVASGVRPSQRRVIRSRWIS